MVKEQEVDKIWLECCELNQMDTRPETSIELKGLEGVLLSNIKTHFRLKKQRRENLMLWRIQYETSNSIQSGVIYWLFTTHHTQKGTKQPNFRFL